MNATAPLPAPQDAAAPGLKRVHPILVARADNALLWDEDGKRYIDFIAGIGVLNTGHRHPRVMAAVHDQLERFTHSCFNAVPHRPYLAVCDWLNRRCPIDGPARSMLTNSGAEAMENALKLARAASGRQAVIAFEGGFHGRTLATLALTGKATPYKTGLGPLPGPVYHVPYASADGGVATAAALGALDRLVCSSVAPGDVAAVVIEPVQGEGGFLPADVEFLRALRARCDRHGWLLIADEIQSGFCRSGKLFAIEHSAVSPDILVMGKGIAGGFPLAAVTGTAAVMGALGPGGLGGTYSGNPVACAAAMAVFAVIEDDGLCARAEALGRQMATRIAQLAAGPGGGAVGRVRGIGALRAFELVDAAGAPAPTVLQAVLCAARERGLLLMPSGAHGNVIRLLPPLTMPTALVDEAFDILQDVFAAL